MNEIRTALCLAALGWSLSACLQAPSQKTDTGEPRETDPPADTAPPTDTGDPEDTGDPGDTGPSDDCQDEDGDGYGTGDDRSGCTYEEEDCDDSDASVHPGAAETWYDGIDSDCDNASDFDADGDDFDAETFNGSDCDDTDASVHPGATETWYDGIDSDCDDASDYDADGDGHDHDDWGGDDCEDADAGIHPGALEWNDSEDWNCDGTSDYLPLDTAPARIAGNHAGDAASTALAPAGDLNDDGYDDFLVGAPEEDLAGSDSGAAWVVMGPVSGEAILEDVAYELAGTHSEYYSGYAVAGGHDLDGDGYEDLAVGAPFATYGRTYLVGGPVTADLSLNEGFAIIDGENEWDFAGCALALGDHDGDGMGDLVVGASDHAAGGESAAGAVYVLHGPLSGTLDASEADLELEGEAASDYAGGSVATLDADADGLADILIGAYNHDHNDTDTGVAYLVYGATGGGTLSMGDADLRILGSNEEDELGSWVASPGDTNGDGNDDLLVGAEGAELSSTGTDAGVVYLFLGPPPTTIDNYVYDTRAEAIFYGGDGHEAGQVAGAGDVDGDGNDDMLVGASDADGLNDASGVAWLVLGGGGSGTFDLTEEADVVMYGVGTDDAAGRSLSPAGDVNGDGNDDFLVGAHHESSGGSYAGMVYLLHGPGP